MALLRFRNGFADCTNKPGTNATRNKFIKPRARSRNQAVVALGRLTKMRAHFSVRPLG